MGITNFRTGDVVRSKGTGRIGEIIWEGIGSTPRLTVEWEDGREEEVFYFDVELVSRDCRYCESEMVYSKEAEKYVCPFCDLKKKRDPPNQVELSEFELK